MESAVPRSLETTFGYRSGLSAVDDGFDPLLEIRRLRQDLMLRLQRLQQSIVADEKKRADTSPSSCSAVPSTLEPTGIIRTSGSATVIYVAPLLRRPDDISADSPLSELTALTQSASDQSECETPVLETIADPAAAQTVPSESLFTRILARINIVLIAIGAAAAIVGIYYHVLRKPAASPKQIALTLLAMGVAMVVIGVVGWWLHRQAKRQVSVGITDPGSY